MGVKSRLLAFTEREIVRLESSTKMMADTILSRSRVLAPEDTGALKADGRVEKIEGGHRVRYGGNAVPYARRRHFENKKNPQTLHYLERAGDSVAKESPKKYIK